MTPAQVLTALLALAPWHGDRDLSREERTAMLAPVAEAISATARTTEEAAFLIADASEESHLASYVLADRCMEGPRGEQCDPDRHGVPRAHGPFQAWVQYSHTKDLVGEARFVLGQARLGKARCASWEGAFSALHSSSTCNWEGAARRVQTMRWVLAKLEGRP